MEFVLPGGRLVRPKVDGVTIRDYAPEIQKALRRAGISDGHEQFQVWPPAQALGVKYGRIPGKHPLADYPLSRFVVKPTAPIPPQVIRFTVNLPGGSEPLPQKIRED